MPVTPEELRGALLDAVARADGERIGRLLDHAFARFQLERTFARSFTRCCRTSGRLGRGRFTVAQEHLVSAAVRARLERLLADARGGVRGSPCSRARPASGTSWDC